MPSLLCALRLSNALALALFINDSVSYSSDYEHNKRIVSAQRDFSGHTHYDAASYTMCNDTHTVV
jgi:hypothetical protein